MRNRLIVWLMFGLSISATHILGQCLEGCDALIELDGRIDGEYFGWQAEAVGDFDGDGIVDFYVSATLARPGNATTGDVSIFSGATGARIIAYPGLTPGAQFGFDVDTIGDLDEDGVPDMIVGAPFSNRGNAYLISGGDGHHLHDFTGKSQSSQFGLRVTGLNDFDGDDARDIAIAAPKDGATGRVYVYAAGDGRLIAQIDGEAAGDNFGSMVSSAGDVNRDGRDDLLIGAPDAGSGAQGKAYVYAWVEQSLQLLHTLEPNEPGRDFGQYFGNGGADLNCDRIPDLYVTDFVDNRAYVFSGANGDLIHKFRGDGSGQFGLGEMAQDINGDGYGDLILADWINNRGGQQAGKVYLYSGRDGELLQTLTHDIPFAQFGYDAKVLGDVNGDGLADLLITAAGDNNARGRVYVIAGEDHHDPNAEICEPPSQTIEPDLVYPWVSSNALYESKIIVNNTRDQAATVVFQARRAQGDVYTSSGYEIAAHGFLSTDPQTLFEGIGSGSGMTLVLQSSIPGVTGRWVTNNLTAASGMSPAQGVAVRLDDQRSVRRGRSVLLGYLPISASLTSAPVVVNLSDQPTDVTLRFYSASGTLLHEQENRLEPLRPFAEIANDLLPGIEQSVACVATAQTGEITGCVFVFNHENETAIGNATNLDPAETEGNELVYAWVSNNQQFESILVANNTGAEAAMVNLTATRFDGTTQTVGPIEIPPNGFLQQSVSTLFPQMGEGPGYSVRLVAESGRVFGQWVTNNLDTASGRSPAQGIAVRVGGDCPDDARSGHAIEFGFLPITNGFAAAPVLVNLGPDSADVRLSFYNQQGERVYEDVTTLAGFVAYRPYAELVQAIAAGVSEDVALVAQTEGQCLTGVSFVFNTGAEPSIGNVTSVPPQ